MNKVEGLTLSHDSGALKVQNHGDKICLASDMGFVPLQLMKHGQMVTCVSRIVVMLAKPCHKRDVKHP